jgi:hypothetical protein
MDKFTQTIYQSGEQVPHSATYQVVGANPNTAPDKKEHAVRTLKMGDFFPSYEGRAVCWHDAESIARPAMAARQF